MGLPGNYRRAGSGSWQGGAEASSQHFEFERHVPDPVLLAQPLLQGPLDLLHAGQVGFVDDYVRLEGQMMFVELPDVHVVQSHPCAVWRRSAAMCRGARFSGVPSIRMCAV